MKVLIKIPNNAYEWINEHKGVTDFKTTEMLYNRVRDGISLNGTNGEVLMKMFPPSVYFPSEGKYMVLLTKDCLVSCSNADWWNADYKGVE